MQPPRPLVSNNFLQLPLRIPWHLQNFRTGPPLACFNPNDERGEGEWIAIRSYLLLLLHLSTGSLPIITAVRPQAKPGAKTACWGVVQLVGHLTVNEDGEGSNPSAPANLSNRRNCCYDMAAASYDRRTGAEPIGYLRSIPVANPFPRRTFQYAREISRRNGAKAGTEYCKPWT